MANPDQQLEFTKFEAQIHDEILVYGTTIQFELGSGEFGTPESQSFLGELTVGGSLRETEDIEGVVVDYWVMQQFPRTRIESLSGKFVMQSFTRERLEEKARSAVEKMRDKVLFDEMMDDISSQVSAAAAAKQQIADSGTVQPNEDYL